MADNDDISGRVRLRELKTLSDNHYILRKASFDFQRRDGGWQSLDRESYELGEAAVVLPVDQARGKVLLIRQFRLPCLLWGYKQLLLEAVAGKLDGDTPEVCIAREAMEEAGVAIFNLRLISHCFTSPGAVQERAWFYLADYDSSAPREKGGGHEEEGEDIEVLEMSLDQAMAMVTSGEIVDLKTIMLLQAAKLEA